MKSIQPSITALILFLLLALPLVLRGWNLRLIYTDASIRNKVEFTLESLSEKRGWLLSDIRIDLVTETSMQILWEDHRRGDTDRTCLVIELSSSQVTPCAERS